MSRQVAEPLQEVSFICCRSIRSPAGTDQLHSTTHGFRHRPCLSPTPMHWTCRRLPIDVIHTIENVDPPTYPLLRSSKRVSSRHWIRSHSVWNTTSCKNTQLLQKESHSTGTKNSQDMSSGYPDLCPAACKCNAWPYASTSGNCTAQSGMSLSPVLWKSSWRHFHGVRICNPGRKARTCHSPFSTAIRIPRTLSAGRRVVNMMRRSYIPSTGICTQYFNIKVVRGQWTNGGR
jgi:hypothetical protein